MCSIWACDILTMLKYCVWRCHIHSQKMVLFHTRGVICKNSQLIRPGQSSHQTQCLQQLCSGDLLLSTSLFAVCTICKCKCKQSHQNKKDEYIYMIWKVLLLTKHAIPLTMTVWVNIFIHKLIHKQNKQHSAWPEFFDMLEINEKDISMSHE